MAARESYEETSEDEASNGERAAHQRFAARPPTGPPKCIGLAGHHYACGQGVGQESRHPDSRCESWADRACFPIKSPVARDLEFSPFDAAALSRRVRGGQFDREMRF